MIIQRCKIENFGKLSNFTYDFDQGINIICEENGWGKSTLTAFIKVMLYGLTKKPASEVKDKELGDERRRYEPWQGGVYGGEMIFSVAEKVYKVKRIFGETAKKDKFYLYDGISNKESKDYTDNLGVELFHIDSASFERTILLSQQDSSYGMNSVIQSKLGNLVEEADDIKNYNKVIKELDKSIHEMKSPRAIGTLDSIRKNIDLIRPKVQSIEMKEEEFKALVSRYEKLLEYKESKKIEESVLINKISSYQDERVRQAGIRNYYEEKAHYNEIASKLEKSKALIREEDIDIFQSDVEELLKTRVSYIQKTSELQLSKFNKEEEIYYEKLGKYANIPYANDDEIEEVEQWITDLNQERVKVIRSQLSSEEELALSEYKSKFGTEANVRNQWREEIHKFDTYTEKYERSVWLQHDITSKKELLSRLDTEISKDKGRDKVRDKVRNKTKDKAEWNKGSIWLSIIFDILSVLLFDIHVGLGALCLLIGCLIMLAECVRYNKSKPNSWKSKNSNNPLEEVRLEMMSHEAEYVKIKEYLSVILAGYGIEWNVRDLKGQLDNLKQEYRTYIELIKKKEECENLVKNTEIPYIESRIIGFFQKHHINYEETSDSQEWIQLLYGFKREQFDYQLFNRKRAKSKSVSEECEKIEKVIIRFLKHYEYNTDGDLYEMLENIKEHIKTYQEQLKSLKVSQIKLDEYTAQYQINEGEKDGQPLDIQPLLAELQVKQLNLIDEMKEIEDRLRTSKTTMGEMQEELSILRNHRIELSSEEEKEIVFSKKYDILIRTKEFLEKAKESYITRFKQPLEIAFEKYYNLLTKLYPKDFTLDIDGKLSVDSYGVERNTKFLSSGTIDLVNICMRMAIIDAMYENEYPILIYDDPFVHLDEEKLESAKVLLKEVSKRYQIIYFTCHSSRM